MRYQHLSVADVMSEPPITIRERETLAVASERMQASGTRHLPVVDQHGHLVGIVASRDLYRELAREGGRDLRVGEVMTAEVATARAQHRRAARGG
jgi:CBS domain-containing protein